MSSPQTRPTCSRCSRCFTKTSSLTRHRKRCLQNIKGPSRRKSCVACAGSKLRCDLQRPSCSRCLERTLVCEYASRDGTAIAPSLAAVTAGGSILHDQSPDDQSLRYNEAVNASTVSSAQKTTSSIESIGSSTLPESDDPLSLVDCGAESTPPSQADTSRENVSRGSVSDRDGTFDSMTAEPGIGRGVFEESGIDNPEMIAPELIISSYRRQILLGAARDTPNTDPVARHTMHFVIRVLKSWPRMMATHHTSHLPPIIHRLQLADGIPIPLAYCYTLAKMWITHSEGSRDLVQKTIHDEVRRLLRDYNTYNVMELLAAAQSMLILLIILFFGIGPSPALAHPIDAQLLIDMWNVKRSLASTGLFLEQESNHTLPSWKEWAIVSAKRRTILGLHHLEWAWSLRYGYPILTCFELGPFPAPAARYLWQNAHEKEWQCLYKDWLRQWADGSYKMMELFRVNAGKESDALDPRSELWLAEADEFGVMLMAETNGIGVQY